MTVVDISILLRRADREGQCLVVNAHGGMRGAMLRDLHEHATLIRSSRAVAIARKVRGQASSFLSGTASSQRAFDLRPPSLLPVLVQQRP